MAVFSHLQRSTVEPSILQELNLTWRPWAHSHRFYTSGTGQVAPRRHNFPETIAPSLSQQQCPNTCVYDWYSWLDIWTRLLICGLSLSVFSQMQWRFNKFKKCILDYIEIIVHSCATFSKAHRIYPLPDSMRWRTLNLKCACRIIVLERTMKSWQRHEDSVNWFFF